MSPPSPARPRVTVHYAQTLDGRIATRTGQSQWIGGEASLRLAHQLRAEHEAIMVGVGTVTADNPRLTVRLVPGTSPLRVIVDSTLRLSLSSNVLCDGAAHTIVATTCHALEDRIAAVTRLGAEVLVLDQDCDGRVNLGELLRRLRCRGVGSLLLEGGRRLITSALEEGVVDRLVVCISPKVMGAGIEAVGDLGIERLAEALTFEECSFTNLDGDVIFDGRLAARRGGEAGSTDESRLARTEESDRGVEASAGQGRETSSPGIDASAGQGAEAPGPGIDASAGQAAEASCGPGIDASAGQAAEASLSLSSSPAKASIPRNEGAAKASTPGDGTDRRQEPAPTHHSSLVTHHSAQSPALGTQHGEVATAVWFPRARQVELRSETLPEVGTEEVRVRAIASAVSHGTEMLVYRGQVPAELPLDLPTLRGGFAFPIKYGYASVGLIEEAGSTVRTVREGDPVFVHHPHQDRYVVPASMAVPLDAKMDPRAGVFLANLETAVNVVLDAGIKLGERVVIFGQGVVGLLLTQLARRVGAGLVVTVDPIPLRREMSSSSGADAALAPGPHLPAQVRRLCGGDGADVVLEASGQGEALDAAIDCSAFQGTVVVCSWYGTKPVSLMLGGAFHRGRLRLVSSQVSNLDPALQPRWSRARRLELARQLLGELELSGLITHDVPFRRAADAYRLLDEHPEQTVQLLLTYAT